MNKIRKQQSRDTILIIEDAEVNRAILGQMFEKEYRIAEGRNGLEGIQYMEQHQDEIVMVLLDIRMPVMDGYQVMEYMKDKGYMQYIPVILITSDDAGDAMERGYALGATDIVKKPFKASIVIQRVGNVIELYHHKNHLEELVKLQTEELNRQNDMLKRHNRTMLGLLRDIITFRNMESEQHIRFVEGYTRILAKQYAVLYPRSRRTERKIGYIVQAAGMHDLGKITMPDLLIKRQGCLLPEEIEYLKEHTVKGSDIIKVMSEFQNSDVYRICYNVCRYHHEKYDGTGYPEGMKGEKIPVEAQIVALADMYDALINVTANKEAYSKEQAFRMLLDGECGELSPRMKECLLASKKELEEFVL